MPKINKPFVPQQPGAGIDNYIDGGPTRAGLEELRGKTNAAPVTWGTVAEAEAASYTEPESVVVTETGRTYTYSASSEAARDGIRVLSPSGGGRLHMTAPVMTDAEVAAATRTATPSQSGLMGAEQAQSVANSAVAGTTGQVQYNNNGALGASSSLSWDEANKRLSVDSLSKVNSQHRPVENWNFFSNQKLWNLETTNALYGRGCNLRIYRDAVEIGEANRRVVTEGNFENSANVNWRGLDGDAAHVYRFDLSVLYGANGIAYTVNSKFILNFYAGYGGRFPSAWSARVKNRDGIYTTMSLIAEGNDTDGYHLVGNIPISNYLVEVEVTLSTGTGAPYITGTAKWSITQVQLHLGRMAASQGGSITSAGGYLGANLTCCPGVTISGGAGVTLGATGIGVSQATPTARLHVKGPTSDSSGYALKIDKSSNDKNFYVRDDGQVDSSGSRVIGFQEVASDYTLSQSSRSSVVCNPAGTGMVLTMHLSPPDGILQTVVNASAFAVTLGRNGQKIAGLESNYTLPANTSITLQFFGATLGWLIISQG